MEGRTGFVVWMACVAALLGEATVSGQKGATNVDRVKVSVYFESLCSDSQRFFEDQLAPAWRDLQDIMDLELIPFGKARATPQGTGRYTFECQHGANECYGNLVMACIQNSLPIGTQMQVLTCMMTSRYPAFMGGRCTAQVGVDWEPLEQCSRSAAGEAMLYKNGVRTASLKPRVYFIPTITINGHYDRNHLRVSLRDLKSQICSAYKGPPHQNCL